MNSIFKNEYLPSDIFKPRGEYNKEMYINRPDYEKDFNDRLKSDLNILVHGQSGTGKSWLTQNVLKNNNITYKTVNLTHASNSGSVLSCFKDIMDREKWKILTGYTETKGASIGITGTNGKLEHTSQYAQQTNYFMEFLKFMWFRDGKSDTRRYIVLENFEQIVDDTRILKEISNYLTLIDDEEVMKYNTKFILIGASVDFRKYFSLIANINTIDNRTTELPEVSTLTTTQSHKLIERGFSALNIAFVSEDIRNEYFKHIAWVTGGIPQRLHEYCLKLSNICVENLNREAKSSFLKVADKQWLSDSLNTNYVKVTKLLSHNGNKISRKNQILYCLGFIEKDCFTIKDVREGIYAEFPNTTKNKQLNITAILNALCISNPSTSVILEKNPHTNEYSFADPKIIMCLRTMLFKSLEENVYKYNYNEI